MATEYVIHKTFDPSAFKVDYRKELNAEQFAVVEQGEGPCLVLAGAGSGKTRTIVYRVAYLLEQGVDPSQILLVTFTNKAAKEMMVRIESLLGQYPKGIWGGTFHSVANRLLRKYGTAIGFNPNFTILDQDDSRDLISACVKSLHIDTKKIRFPSNGVIQGLISLCSNTGMEMADVVEMSKPEFVRVQVDLEKVFRLYRERKERNNAMDFDDLLVQLRRLLRDHPQIKEKLAGQFKYVLVDEYQDTNHLQDDIVRQLSSFHNNLLVVGDDAQSIYSFRGADITNILDFPKRYSNAKTFKLETNYRSTQAVLDVANEIIKHNPDQFQKSLKHVREGSIRPIIVPAATDDQEAEFITQRILDLCEEGVQLKDIAVLFRAAFHSQALELELTKRDIPYEYRGGVRFFDRAHIKDALAFLKVVGNPRDEIAFSRVLRLQVGIGDQTASNVFEEVLARLPGDTSERHPFEEIFETYSPPARASSGWKNFRSLMTELIGSLQGSPEQMVKVILDSEYRDYLFAEFQDANDRVQDLEQLALFAGKYATLDQFLAEVTLQEDFGVIGGAADNGDREKIVLSTIHQAKGLEWKAVFVMHLSDLYFPSPRSLGEERGIEEERRLFYVAVTRSEEHLYLTYPITTGFHGNVQMSRPSPFVQEIPHRLLETYHLSEEAAAEQEEYIDPDQVIDLDVEHSSLLDRVMWSNDRKKKNKGTTSW